MNLDAHLSLGPALCLGAVFCFTAAGCGDGSDGGGQEAPFSMGVGLSPRYHTGGSSVQDWIDHFSGHAPWGRIIAFHGNWRDSMESAGQIPSLALAAMSAADQYDFTPVIGLGWTVGGGSPDLVSRTDTLDDSWANTETRDEFLAMVVDLAGEYRPPFLFLGNELNMYYNTHTDEEWRSWLEEYSACYDAIKAVSPATVVYTTFQYELLEGLGSHNGWSYPADWRPVDDLVDTGRLDALGFTSYPYFEYDNPDEIPGDYYERIAEHWSGPVLFSEIGWLGGESPPYSGGETEQAEFIARFFQLTESLELYYAVWLFLHDWDGQDSQPAFRFIGLRENDGSPRLADEVWRSEAAARE